VFPTRISRAFSSITHDDTVARSPAQENQCQLWSDAQTEERRKQFSELLQTELSPKIFQLLKKANFSAEIKSSLLSLMGSAMNQLAVAHRGALVPFEGRSITIRHMLGGRLGPGGEEKLSNLNRIKDQQQVREESACRLVSTRQS